MVGFLPFSLSYKEERRCRIYPPIGISAEEIEQVEGKVASRCVEILVEKGVSICAAVYD